LSKILYTVEETANILSLGRTVVYQLLASGELESVKVGRARRVLYTSIENFVAKLTQANQSEGIR